MNNECKVVFLCKNSDETPCAFHSKDFTGCKWCKEYHDIKACVSKKARIHALNKKLDKMEMRK